MVNRIILGRAGVFAARNAPLPALADGAGRGVGFTLALFVLGAVREVPGTSALFGASYQPLLLILPPGAFIALGLLLAAMNRWERHGK